MSKKELIYFVFDYCGRLRMRKTSNESMTSTATTTSSCTTCTTGSEKGTPTTTR